MSRLLTPTFLMRSPIMFMASILVDGAIGMFILLLLLLLLLMTPPTTSLPTDKHLKHSINKMLFIIQ